MIRSLLSALILAAVTTAPGKTGNHKTQAPDASQSDLAWARAFALPGEKDGDHKWDPRFRALMRTSFSQRQSFWRDHGRFQSVPELVQVFLGVPEGVTLDGDRYVTLSGCVPHACGARGMVWIDTRSRGKPLVIFAVPEDVSTPDSDKRALQHLWLYSSVALNWQKMPPDFTDSLARWYSSYQATWAKDYRMDLLMLTLVEPSGLYYDLAPGLLNLAPGEASAR